MLLSAFVCGLPAYRTIATTVYACLRTDTAWYYMPARGLDPDIRSLHAYAYTGRGSAVIGKGS